MLTAFIVSGSLFFWLSILAICIFIIMAIDVESSFVATVTLFVTIVFFQVFSDFQPLTWIYDNLLTSLIILVGYFICGSIWSVVKWYLYCLKQRDDYILRKDDYVASYKQSSGGKTYEEWLKFYYPPKPTDINNKNRILMWMTYWPFSAIWTLICDPIKYLWRNIYRLLSDLYGKISDSVFKGHI